MIKTDDLKEGYRWLSRMIWCPDAGYHTLFYCLSCQKKLRCSILKDFKEVKKLTRKKVLKEESDVIS